VVAASCLYLFGKQYKWSQNRTIPKLLRAKWFKYGFLFLFLIMFINMVISTLFVFTGANQLNVVITLLWTWKLPWHWVNTSFVSPWVAQFAFGFYSMMLTSTILGLIITMFLYKPRSWCVYCPMGTATQAKYKDSQGD
jgi:hypothetical protein